MKRNLILGALALITTTLFSCTADDSESDSKSASEARKLEINTEKTQAIQLQGPDDDPITVPPPPKKNQS